MWSSVNVVYYYSIVLLLKIVKKNTNVCTHNQSTARKIRQLNVQVCSQSRMQSLKQNIVMCVSLNQGSMKTVQCGNRRAVTIVISLIYRQLYAIQ